MRTTVTLEPDVVDKLRRAVRQKGLTFKAAINAALRRGLSSGSRHRGKKFRVVAHRGGFQPGVDLQRLNQVLDDLDAADFAGESR